MKTDAIHANDGLFKNNQTHSPQEILAAGGTTAFGRKSNKNNSSLIGKLKAAPAIESFDEGEWDNVLAQLNKDK